MIGRALLVILLLGLAWLAWQRPAPAPTPMPVRASVPAAPTFVKPQIEEEAPAADEPVQLWRVVTHRLITPDAAKTLGKQLRELQLEPFKIESRELVTLHAFDNPERLETLASARQVKNEWLENEIDAFVIEEKDGRYLVGLGRFYQIEHAERMQDRLRATGRAYSYKRRTIPIPVVRFTFAPGNKAEVDKLWQQLEAAGIMMPVSMPEERFQELYGDAAKYKISEAVE